jgi:hypothetical protein
MGLELNGTSAPGLLLGIINTTENDTENLLDTCREVSVRINAEREHSSWSPFFKNVA